MRTKEETIELISEAGVFKDKKGLLENIYKGFKKEIDGSKFTRKQIIDISDNYQALKSLLSWHNFDTLIEILKTEKE